MRADRLSRFLIGCLLIPALSILSPAASAGGFSSLDFGSRRLGMMAVVGKPDDLTSLFHNPAGLTLLHGWNFYHGQTWIIGDTQFKMYDSEGTLHPSDHTISPDWNVGVLPFLAVASDLGTERVRVGLSVYAPNGFGASLPENEPTRYHLASALFISSRASITGAVEVTRRFSIGASVSLICNYLKARRAMNALVFQDPDNRFLPYDEVADSDAWLDLDGLGWSWAVDVGVLMEPLDGFRLGASFTGGSMVDMEGKVKLTYPDGSVEQAQQTTTMAIPFTLRAGINWEFSPDFEFGADVTYWHYQVLQEQRTELSSPVMGFTEFLDPKNYGNGLLWCFGLMYHMTDSWDLMAGFQQDYAPIPEQTVTLETSARDTKAVSLGARWQVTDAVRVGAAFERLWNDLADVQGSETVPPTNIKGPGGLTYFMADILITPRAHRPH